MPDLLAPFQEASKTLALDIVAKSPATAAALQATFAQHFPSQPVSAVTAAFANDSNLRSNPTCTNAVSAALDAADQVSTSLTALEQYINLTVPKMEDGGNFGVGIQLAALKVVSDQADKLDKSVEELYKYASARADALEKCKQLPSTSTTKSTTTSTNASDGTDKEKGAVSSSSNSNATEEKTTESVATSPDADLRKLAVASVDTKYYQKAKATLALALTALLSVADFVDKNQVKIDKPKGDSGSRGYSSSMY